MPLLIRHETAKENSHKWSCKFDVCTIQTGRFISTFLRFCLLLLLIFNLQTFGEATDFCFDGSNEGRLLQIIIFALFDRGHLYPYTFVKTDCKSLKTFFNKQKGCYCFPSYVTGGYNTPNLVPRANARGESLAPTGIFAEFHWSVNSHS